MPIKLRAFLDFAIPQLKEGLADMAQAKPSKARAKT
jgi:hypothetical protein